MPRVKTGIVRRAAHKKILSANKGYRMTKRRLYKKRDFRTLWIGRITASLKLQDGAISYSKFINALVEKKVSLNRKSLSTLAVKFPEVFSSVFKFTTSK